MTKSNSTEKRRHLNIRVTEDEYNRLKQFCTEHGSITLLIRSMVRKFLVERERSLSLAGQENTNEEG